MGVGEGGRIMLNKINFSLFEEVANIDDKMLFIVCLFHDIFF